MQVMLTARTLDNGTVRYAVLCGGTPIMADNPLLDTAYQIWRDALAAYPSAVPALWESPQEAETVPPDTKLQTVLRFFGIRP